ncbi:MAG TPA: alpha/beta hydrolase [Polyangiaceae bacterium]|nr:alpha/beta hydrolase [Polyangiaceae bacterium]
MKSFMLTRRDGAPLLGYRAGTSGPALALANGLGGPVSAFRHQIEHFERGFRVVTWDYRGLYGSRGDAPPDRVDVGAQAADLEDLLRSITDEPAVVVGWSMGVQVALELVRVAPERVRALVLVSGTYGRPMTNLRVPRAERWLPELIERVRPYHAVGSRLVALAARSRRAADLVRRLGFVNPRLETETLLALAREFKELDFDVYLRTLAALERHDTAARLAAVKQRTLVVAGERDPLFSPRVARDLSERLPHAELYVVPRATHYAPLEFPELVNARIDAFLAEILRPGVATPAAASSLVD